MSYRGPETPNTSPRRDSFPNSRNKTYWRNTSVNLLDIEKKSRRKRRYGGDGELINVASCASDKSNATTNDDGIFNNMREYSLKYVDKLMVDPNKPLVACPSISAEIAGKEISIHIDTGSHITWLSQKLISENLEHFSQCPISSYTRNKIYRKKVKYFGKKQRRK